MKILDFSKLNKKFWCANIIMVIICYGFAMTNSSIGIDDESIVRALSGRMYEQGRLGLDIINSVFDISCYLPFFYMCLCMCLFILSNAIITNFFNNIYGEFSGTPSIVFSVVVISYPSFAYKLIFNVNQLQIGLVYLVAVLCTIHCYKIFKEKSAKKESIFAIFEVFFIVSNFETGLIYVGILLMYSIILDNESEHLGKTVLKLSKVGFVFVIGMLLNKFLVFLVREYYGIVADNYVSNYIAYSRGNFVGNFKDAVLGFWKAQINDGVTSVLLFFVIIGLFILVKKQKLKTSCKFILVIALFVLYMAFPIITGNHQQAERTLLYEAFFWAVCASSAVIVFRAQRVIYSIFWVIFGLNLYTNTLEINKVMYNDYVRSELDKNLAYEIYSDIQCYSYKTKPVVFVGASGMYDLPYDIDLGISSYYRHDIAWNGNLVYETPSFRLYSYFNMLGLSILEADDILTVESVQYSMEAPIYPAEGSVFETEDVIVVKLGQVSLYSNLNKEHLLYDEFEFNEDVYQEEQEYIYCSGWVWSEEYIPIRLKKYLLFEEKNTGTRFVTQCADVERSDVTVQYNLMEQYKWAGYSIKLNKANIPKGDYAVRVIAYMDGTYYDYGSDVHDLVVE